jgi:hypothetical protein
MPRPVLEADWILSELRSDSCGWVKMTLKQFLKDPLLAHGCACDGDW